MFINAAKTRVIVTSAILILVALGSFSIYRAIKQERELARRYRHLLSLALSPDGDTVFYDDRIDDIPVIAADSQSTWGNRQRLVESNAAAPMPTADGTKLYFHRGQDSYGDFTEIWCKSLDSGESRIVIKASDFHLTSISLEGISPDGEWLLVLYPDYSKGVGKRRLFHKDGTIVKDTPPFDQAWLSDKGAFTMTRGKLEFWKRDGGHEGINGFEDCEIEQISSDGKIAFVSIRREAGEAPRYRLFRLEDRTLIADIEAEHATLSDDGRFAAYYKKGSRANRDLYVLLIDENKTVSLGSITGPMSWMSSPGGLAFRNVVTIYIFDEKTQALKSHPVRKLAK